MICEMSEHTDAASGRGDTSGCANPLALCRPPWHFVAPYDDLTQIVRCVPLHLPGKVYSAKTTEQKADHLLQSRQRKREVLG